MLWLMDELGITKYPQYTAGRKVLHLSDGKIRTYTTSIPTLPLLSLIDLHRFMSAVSIAVYYLLPIYLYYIIQKYSLEAVWTSRVNPTVVNDFTWVSKF